MLVGRVRYAAVDENFARIEAKVGADGFMYYIHSPKDPISGEGSASALTTLNVSQIFAE
jgi:hypothetical protein